MKSVNHISFFNQISISDLAKAGDKNASLGEMYNHLNQKNIFIPNGFSTSADAYRLFRPSNNLEQKLNNLLLLLDTEHYANLTTIGKKASGHILSEELPLEINEPIIKAYKNPLLKQNKI